MNEISEFFVKLLDSSDWPPRWHCGKWSDFHGWLYIISDLLIWSAYFTLPIVIIRYILKKQGLKFVRLYFLFAGFILACGATHLLDAVTFWVPLYRLNALVRLITGVISWVTVFYLVKNLPVIFSLKPQKELENEIEQRTKAETALSILNAELEHKIKERTEALEKSEERFRSIIEQYPSPVVRFTPTGDFISANSEWEIMWHDTLDKAEGYNILKDPKLSQSPLAKNIEAAFSGSVSRSAAYLLDPSIVGKSGRKRWVELLLFPIKDAQGNILEVISVNLDVTQRKESEEQDALFVSIVNSTDDAILSKSLDGIITSWNYGAERLLGYTAAEITGKHISLLIPPRLKDQESEVIEKINGGVMVEHYETERINKSGKLVEVSQTVSPIRNAMGIITGASSILSDISHRKIIERELKKSEHIYRTIASSIPDSIICILDSNYRYLLLEGDMVEKLGYSRNQLLGNKAGDVLGAAVFTKFHSEFEKAFKGELITYEAESKGYDILTKLVPLKDDQQKVYAVLAVSIDITRIKNAQREITQLNLNLEEKITKRTEELKKANEEMSAFSYSVSHDLRSPLRGIIGFSQILEEDYADKLDAEAKRITSVIKTNASKMGQLIDDLLKFSRLGKQEINNVKLDMNPMIQEIIKELLPAYPHGVNIQWETVQLPEVMADISTIRQVWTNLISNAIKYTSYVEQPIINIGSYRQNGSIVFYIKDNGAGFEDEYKDKLFKVFQRLHSAEEFEGTGIGLALVEKIITKHHGSIWAEGKEGQGATFSFSLPA